MKFINVSIVLAFSLVGDVTSTTARAKKALALARQSYADMDEAMTDDLPQVSDLAIYEQDPMALLPNEPSTVAGYQDRRSFLATSVTQGRQQAATSEASSQAQQQAASSEFVTRLSEAIQKNSQALLGLEAQQEQLVSREAAFEDRIHKNANMNSEASGEGVWVQMASSGSCGSFKKNGEGPITGSRSCNNACITAEGLPGGDWDPGRCRCQLKRGNYNQWREICNDKGAALSLSIVTVLSIFVVLLREA